MRSDVSKLVYRARPLSAAGCQKAVIAPLPDCLRRVPELGPCFGNDHPNCAGLEARRSSGFHGCCRRRRHRGNFAGTLARKTTAERDRYPATFLNIIYYYADRFGPLPTEVMAKVLAAPAGTVVRSELTIPVGRRLHQMCGHFPTVPAPGGSRRPREELPAGPRRLAQPPASG